MLEWLEAHQLPCLFREAFGVDCPGCGFQTAFLLLLRGEWMASLEAWPGLLPFIAFLLLALGHIAGLKKTSAEMLKKMGFVCLVIILVSYLFKLFMFLING